MLGMIVDIVDTGSTFGCNLHSNAVLSMVSAQFVNGECNNA